VVASLVAESPFAKDKADLAAILARRRKPILFYSYSLPSERAVADLHEMGAPLFPNLRGPALALAALVAQDAARRAGDLEAFATLDGEEARELVELYGIAIPPHPRKGEEA